MSASADLSTPRRSNVALTSDPTQLGDKAISNVTANLGQLLPDFHVQSTTVRKGSLILTFDLVYMGTTQDVNQKGLVQNSVPTEAWVEWLDLPWPKDGEEVMVQVGDQTAVRVRWDCDAQCWNLGQATTIEPTPSPDEITVIEPQVLCLPKCTEPIPLTMGAKVLCLPKSTEPIQLTMGAKPGASNKLLDPTSDLHHPLAPTRTRTPLPTPQVLCLPKSTEPIQLTMGAKADVISRLLDPTSDLQLHARYMMRAVPLDLEDIHYVLENNNTAKIHSSCNSYHLASISEIQEVGRRPPEASLAKVGGSQATVNVSQGALGGSQATMGGSLRALGASLAKVGGSQATMNVSQGAVGCSQATMGASLAKVGGSQATMNVSQGALGCSLATMGASLAKVGGPQATVNVSQGALGCSHATMGDCQSALGGSQGTKCVSQGALGASQATMGGQGVFQAIAPEGDSSDDPNCIPYEAASMTGGKGVARSPEGGDSRSEGPGCTPSSTGPRKGCCGSDETFDEYRTRHGYMIGKRMDSTRNTCGMAGAEEERTDKHQKAVAVSGVQEEVQPFLVKRAHAVVILLQPMESYVRDADLSAD
eukprot:gene20205-26950_t